VQSELVRALRLRFGPPIFESDELTHRAHTLWVLAWGCFLYAGPLILAMLIAQPESAGQRAGTLAVLLAMVLVLHELNRGGRTRLGGWTLILGLIALVTHRAWFVGGLVAPVSSFYVVFVMMAGLLFGARGCAIAAAICLLCGGALAWAEHAGVMPDPRFGFPPAAQLTYVAIFMLLSFNLQNEFTRKLGRSSSRAELELAERRRVQRKLGLALEGGKIAVFEQDLARDVLEADARFFGHFGLERPAQGLMSWDEWFERVHPDDRHLLVSARDKLKAGSEQESADFRAVHADGTTRWLRACATMLRDEHGRPTRVVGVNMDIDDQKAAERRLEELVATRTRELSAAKEAAETASRAKSAFLASMSHEIRTPMNAIVGYSELLRMDETLSAPQHHKLQVIRNSGDHLLSLINDVLEMSRIEAGRVVVSPDSFELPLLIDQVCAMFGAQASTRGVALDVELAPDLPRCIESDAGKVRQVLINLLGNALKFTRQGAIRVRAHGRSTGPRRCAITVEVSDTGPGIAAVDQERIFHAFDQGSLGPHTGGTGLGLSISRSFAELLDGSLTVQSQPGLGSTFTFSFAGALVDQRTEPTRFASLGSAVRKRPAMVQPLAVDTIPAHLLDELRSAARSARVLRLEELADQIAATSPAAAEAIRAHASEFRYRELLRQLDAAASS
jgi:PAS domain S-box-containing protein